MIVIEDEIENELSAREVWQTQGFQSMNYPTTVVMKEDNIIYNLDKNNNSRDNQIDYVLQKEIQHGDLTAQIIMS